MVKTRRSARLAAARQQAESEDNGSPSVEELAEMAVRRMRLKLSRAALQDELAGDTETQTQQQHQGAVSSRSEIPEMLLLDKAAGNTAGNTGGGHVQKSNSSHTQLSSSLDSGVKEDLYFDLDTAGDSGCVQRSKLSTEDPHKELLKKTVITSDFEKRDAAPPLFQSFRKLQRLKKAERERTAGGSWFNMPAPELTPELRNDLKVVQMRNVLDRSHHYKSSDWKRGKLPKYFQVGTVISGPAEFYSARIPRRQQKRTLVEELLADEELRKYNKRKCVELQKRFQSGTHRYHQQMKKRKKRK